MNQALRICLISLMALGAWTVWRSDSTPTPPAALGVETDAADMPIRLRLERDAALSPPPVRRSLGVARTPQTSLQEPAEPPIPDTAVVLQLLRWPDNEVIDAGTYIQVAETGENRVRQLISPASGRLRLADSLRDSSAPVFVRAQGYEPLRVTGEAAGKSFVYVARLRPTKGWYGRVVDHDGRPLPGLQVSGFWVEDQRPTTSLDADRLLGANALERLGVQGLPAPVVVGRNDRALAFNSASDRASFNPQIDLGSGRTRVGSDRRSRAFRRFRSERKGQTPPAPAFFAAHDRVEATATTNPDGWYYIRPLDGFVLGTLNLLVEHSEGSSDVLRVTIPSSGPRLPRLVIHRPRPIGVRVVDGAGAPVTGARVVQTLAGGYSPEWGPYTTDKDGLVIVDAPYADLWLTVEKTGFSMAAPTAWRPASADGMWKDMHELEPDRGLAREFYLSAYGHWRTVLPRARGMHEVPFSASDALVVLKPEASLQYKVLDSGAEAFPLPNVQLLARYGGIDACTKSTYTALDGVGSVLLCDREWQPMLVTFRAPGYQEKTIAIPPSAKPKMEPIKISLRPGSGKETSRDGTSRPNGQVTAPRGDHSAKLILRAGGPDVRRGKVLWTGSSDKSGAFRYSNPDQELPTLARYLYAVHIDERTGLPASGASMGPIEFDPDREEDEPLPDLVVPLEPGLPLVVILDHLEPERPYRLDWRLAPHANAAPFASGSMRLPGNHGLRYEVPVPVPAGWLVEVRLFGAAIGQGPTLAFDRDAQKTDQPYLSTSPSWDSWQPVSGRDKHLVVHSGRRLYLRAVRRAMLSGIVTGLKTYPEPSIVQVAAIGSLGTWYAPVSGTGWFDFRQLPIDTYRLLLYERPSSVEGPVEPHIQGQVRGEGSVELETDTFDIELEWIDPEAANADEDR